jgi:hypothetical protein
MTGLADIRSSIACINFTFRGGGHRFIEPNRDGGDCAKVAFATRA